MGGVHNSGTAQWKSFISILYCKTTQELQNGVMGIGPSEPKCIPLFKQGIFCEHLHCGAHGHLQVIGLKREDTRRVALSSVFVWSPRNEKNIDLDKTVGKK